MHGRSPLLKRQDSLSAVRRRQDPQGERPVAAAFGLVGVSRQDSQTRQSLISELLDWNDGNHLANIEKLLQSLDATDNKINDVNEMKLNIDKMWSDAHVLKSGAQHEMEDILDAFNNDMLTPEMISEMVLTDDFKAALQRAALTKIPKQVEKLFASVTYLIENMRKGDLPSKEVETEVMMQAKSVMSACTSFQHVLTSSFIRPASSERLSELDQPSPIVSPTPSKLEAAVVRGPASVTLSQPVSGNRFKGLSSYAASKDSIPPALNIIPEDELAESSAQKAGAAIGTAIGVGAKRLSVVPVPLSSPSTTGLSPKNQTGSNGSSSSSLKQQLDKEVLALKGSASDLSLLSTKAEGGAKTEISKGKHRAILVTSSTQTDIEPIGELSGRRIRGVDLAAEGGRQGSRRSRGLSISSVSSTDSTAATSTGLGSLPLTPKDSARRVGGFVQPSGERDSFKTSAGGKTKDSAPLSASSSVVLPGEPDREPGVSSRGSGRGSHSGSSGRDPVKESASVTETTQSGESSKTGRSVSPVAQTRRGSAESLTNVGQSGMLLPSRTRQLRALFGYEMKRTSVRNSLEQQTFCEHLITQLAMPSDLANIDESKVAELLTPQNIVALHNHLIARIAELDEKRIALGKQVPTGRSPISPHRGGGGGAAGLSGEAKAGLKDNRIVRKRLSLTDSPKVTPLASPAGVSENVPDVESETKLDLRSRSGEAPKLSNRPKLNKAMSLAGSALAEGIDKKRRISFLPLVEAMKGHYDEPKVAPVGEKQDAVSLPVQVVHRNEPNKRINPVFKLSDEGNAKESLPQKSAPLASALGISLLVVPPPKKVDKSTSTDSSLAGFGSRLSNHGELVVEAHGIAGAGCRLPLRRIVEAQGTAEGPELSDMGSEAGTELGTYAVPTAKSVGTFAEELKLSDHPLLDLYNQFGSFITADDRARILRAATEDLTSDRAISSFEKIFVHVLSELKLIESSSAEIVSKFKACDAAANAIIQFSALAVSAESARDSLMRSSAQFGEALGEIQSRLLILDLQLLEYRILFERIDAQSLSSLTTLVRRHAVFSESLSLLLVCQGRSVESKRQLHLALQFAARYRLDPLALKPRRGADVSDEDLEARVSALEKENDSLRTDLAAADEDLQSAELELFESLQEMDRTPSALLFFAALDDVATSENLQQLLLQLKHLRGFVDCKTHFDFVELRRRLQVCLAAAPQLDRFLGNFNQLHQKWTKKRLTLFENRMSSGGGAQVHCCPMCNSDYFAVSSSGGLAGALSTRELEALKVSGSTKKIKEIVPFKIK